MAGLNDSLEDFDLGDFKPRITKPKKPKLEVEKVVTKSVKVTKDVGVQVSNERAVSYGKRSSHITHRKLVTEICFVKESTLEFLWSLGLLPRTRACPECGRNMSVIQDMSVSDCRRFYCRVRKSGKFGKQHEKRLSLRTGTFFSQSNMTLEEILEFTYLWTLGTPLKSIEHEMGLSSNTDVDWASFLREVCVHEITMEQKSCKIGGPGIVVEIDESKFAKRKYHRGHPVKTGWVLGGTETENKKKIFMVIVTDRSAQTLLTIIQQWILPGSIIWSDCWKAYDKIPELPEGYSHGKVNHSETYKDKETGVCTNRIESEWGSVKATLPKFGKKEAHLQGYLSAFMWRRFNEGKDLFLSMLRDIAVVYPGM